MHVTKTLLLLLVLFPISAYGQTPPPNIIQWKHDDPRCEQIYSDGDSIRTIHNNGLTVAAIGYEGQGFIVAEISVVNESKERVDVLPEKFVLLLWKDRTKPPEVLTPLPSEKVAGHFTSRAAWGNFFRGLAAGLARSTSETTESGTVSVVGTGGMATGVYSGTSTTTTQNNAAIANTARQNQIATERAQGKANYVINNALKDNTLFPQTYTAGFVYFPRKKFEVSSIVVVIGDTGYTFGFGPKK